MESVKVNIQKQIKFDQFMISPIKNEFQLVNVVQLEPWKRHKMDNVFAKINSLVGLALNVLTVTKEPVVINVKMVITWTQVNALVSSCKCNVF